MARTLFNEQTTRGHAHAVLGIPACLSGRSVLSRRAGVRGIAEDGKPGMYW